ncbi:MAG: hypothetical protein RL199_704 [Pseudomonadota bacterium]|jgi:hypothetical protein
MLERLLDRPLEAWLLRHVARSRTRLAELRRRHPEASVRELAFLLARPSRLRAAAGGLASSFGGLLALPAEEALGAWLALTVVVDVAVLLDRPLKSERARGHLLEVWSEARGALSRTPSPRGGLPERLLTSRTARFAAGIVPVALAPLRAAMRERDLRCVVETALRAYGDVPDAVRRLRARRG